MRLLQLRKERGMSQVALAKILGCSQNMISQWENGTRDPNTQTLIKIAEFFGVSTDYLLGNTEETAMPKTKKVPKDLRKILEEEEIILNGRMMSEEDKNKMLKIIEAAFWEAKELNKRK